MYRTAAQTSEADAEAMEDEWKNRPFWVLSYEAYSRIMEKLHNGGSEGEWSLKVLSFWVVKSNRFQ